MSSCSTVSDLTFAIRTRGGAERMSNPLYWPPARNADLKRWKNLPQAAPIADRRLCSRIAKAIILPKHDPEKWEPIFRKDHA